MRMRLGEVKMGFVMFIQRKELVLSGSGADPLSSTFDHSEARLQAQQSEISGWNLTNDDPVDKVGK